MLLQPVDNGSPGRGSSDASVFPFLIVEITKTDATTSEPVPGAKITIYDAQGKEVYSGTTDADGHMYAVYLPAGTYTFREISAPAGYMKNTTEFTFTIHEDGSVTGDTTITDEPTKVVITKTDLTTGKPLPGAEITIFDKDGNVVFKDVTGEDGTIGKTYLTPGTYTFQETSAPDGYKRRTETFTFTIDQDGVVSGDTEIKDEPTEVVITKSDLTDGKPVPGAVIVIYDKDGKEVFKGTTGKDGTIKITGLKSGTYTFKEDTAPAGYKMNPETFTFTIDKDGNVTGDNEIKDEPLDIELTKTDSDTGKPVEGAVIKVYDKDNNCVYTGSSDANGKYYIPRLEARKYTFIETEAPAGYILSKKTYSFEVLADGSVTGTTSFTNKPSGSTILTSYPYTGNPKTLGLLACVICLCLGGIGAGAIVLKKKKAL